MRITPHLFLFFYSPTSFLSGGSCPVSLCFTGHFFFFVAFFSFFFFLARARLRAAQCTGPQSGSMRASAFQDRQYESAIWLHQIGLDNKPPEYKGSTVLFHYFSYFPRQFAKVADGLIPSNISLCGTRMSFHSCTLAQLASLHDNCSHV